MLPKKTRFGSVHVAVAFALLHFAASPLFAQTRLYFPRVVNGQAERTGIAIANLSTASVNLTFRAYNDQGQLFSAQGVTNPVTRVLKGSQQLAEVVSQIFGTEFITSAWVEVESDSSQILGFFLFFDDAVNFLDGADVASEGTTQLVFTDTAGIELNLINPNTTSMDVTLDLVGELGAVLTSKTVQIGAKGRLKGTVPSLFPSVLTTGNLSVWVSSKSKLFGFGVLGDRTRVLAGLNGHVKTEGAAKLYVPQYVEGGGYTSELTVVNLDSETANVTLRLAGDDGLQIGTDATRTIPGRGRVVIKDPSAFGLSRGSKIIEGYLVVTSNGPRLAGSVVFGDADRTSFEAALPFVNRSLREVVYSQVVQNDIYFTGVAVINLSNQSSTSTIEIYNTDGGLINTGTKVLPTRGRDSFVLIEMFPNLFINRGYIRVRSDQDMATFAVFGTTSSTALAAVPAQSIPLGPPGTPTFRRLETAGELPSTRGNHTAVYDPINKQMLVFGGKGADGTTNDLWALNLQELSWKQLRPSGAPPAARFGHSAIFDPNRGRMIIYSGQQAGAFYNDTWAYDVTTNAWKDISPASADRPVLRYGSIMAYDSVEVRGVSFAGFTDQGRFDDTQAFGLSDARWKDITPSGERPSRRCLHTGVYDSRGHRLVIFGGQSSTGAVNDTWIQDLSTNTWQQVTSAPVPDKRFFSASVYDRGRNRVILFGGSGTEFYNDTWSLDLETNRWSQLFPEGSKPSLRDSHSAIWIETERRLIIFGGSSGGSTFNDVFELRVP